MQLAVVCTGLAASAARRNQNWRNRGCERHGYEALCGDEQCFSLRAAVRCAAYDRQALEQLCASAPTDEALQAVLHKIITRMTQAAHPSGGVGRRGGFDQYG